ncbi:hypothetical protein [Streptomyces sp. NPDC006384]|uniref:hypothetical protein n=1 Tax=Streptomyces sp. NPDC006384 TaxID=3364745 RepID=UPI00368400D8
MPLPDGHRGTSPVRGIDHVGVTVPGTETAAARVEEAGGRVLPGPNPLPGPENGQRNRLVHTHTPWGSTLEPITHPDPQPYEKHTARRRRRP